MEGPWSCQAVAPGVDRIESRLGSRRLAQWLLRGSERTLLVDSGVAGTVRDVLAPALAQLGYGIERVTDVLLTHADVDHYGGNAELRALAPAARLRAHPLDRPLIESWAAIAAARYGWYRAHGLDYDAATWRWLQDAAGPDTRLDGEVADGERIELGGLTLKLLHLPGHSRGHVGLWHAASGTAIVADAVMGRGFETAEGAPAGPPPYVDLAAYRATIARLRALAPARLETSHFAPLTGAAVGRFLDRSERLTEDLERALVRHGAAGGSPITRLPAPLAAGGPSIAQLLAPVAAELGGYPEMEVELARSIGAHLER